MTVWRSVSGGRMYKEPPRSKERTSDEKDFNNVSGNRINANNWEEEVHKLHHSSYRRELMDFLDENEYQENLGIHERVNENIINLMKERVNKFNDFMADCFTRLYDDLFKKDD